MRAVEGDNERKGTHERKENVYYIRAPEVNAGKTLVADEMNFANIFDSRVRVCF